MNPGKSRVWFQTIEHSYRNFEIGKKLCSSKKRHILMSLNRIKTKAPSKRKWVKSLAVYIPRMRSSFQSVVHNKNLVLSNELIKVELPLWKIWKADVSSVSPSSELRSKSFTVVIQPLSTRLIKPNFCFDLSHRRSTTVSLETRNSFCSTKLWRRASSYNVTRWPKNGPVKVSSTRR